MNTSGGFCIGNVFIKRIVMQTDSYKSTNPLKGKIYNKHTNYKKQEISLLKQHGL